MIPHEKITFLTGMQRTCQLIQSVLYPGLYPPRRQYRLGKTQAAFYALFMGNSFSSEERSGHAAAFRTFQVRKYYS
jgi:hypothetical protein